MVKPHCSNFKIMEPRHEKTCFMPYTNNKGAAQPAHPRSLISTFVVRCLDSIIPILAKSKIPRLELASEAAQTGFGNYQRQVFS